MKKLISLLVLFVGLSLFTGCGSSNSPINDSPPGEDEGTGNPSLMEALKNPKINDLAGDEGIYITFVQSFDGTTMVNDVEALDTLYFLSAVGIEQTQVIETNKFIDIVDTRLVDEVWGETALYYPANLPDIDFAGAYNAVKVVSGDKPIASISIRYTLVPSEPLIVAFTLEGANAGTCDEYDYAVETGEVDLVAYGIACFFDINYGGSR